MENSLSQYMGRDLKKAISGLEIVQGVARNTGDPYYAVEIAFINGYKKRIFLRSDEQFAWTNAFDLLDSDKQVEL